MTDRLADHQYATLEPVPRHRRNSRRGYDETGRELKPMTLASTLECEASGVIATCQSMGCGHEARIDTTGMPGDLPVPDVSLRLRCSACGSKDIRTAPDWSRLSARYSRGITGATGTARER